MSLRTSPSLKTRPLRLAILTTQSREVFRQSIDTVSRAGQTLDIINPADLVLTVSEHGPQLSQVSNLRASAVGRMDVIFNHAGREWISIFGDALKVMAVPVLNDWQACETAGDKLKALVRVAGSGLRLPKTTFLAGNCFRTRMAEAEAYLGYPMVVKERRSDRGEKVFLVNSRREAWDIWSDAATQDQFLLQQYLGGENLRGVVVGRTIVYCVRTIPQPGEFRSNRRFSSAVEPVTLSDADARSVIDACDRLGLFFAGVDLIRSTSGLWFLEANTQPGVKDDLDLVPELRERLYRGFGQELISSGKTIRQQSLRRKKWN